MKKSAVLIEDDIWLAESFRSILSAGNYQVRIVASGYEAIAAIDKEAPDIIVADILLGDHTSFMLFHELQSYEDTAQIPIVLCTSINTAQLKDIDLQSYGIVAVLDKASVTPDKLRLTVNEYTGEIKRSGR